MRFTSLEAITGGKLVQVSSDRDVTSLMVDSRKALISEGTVFFAIRGERHDGHKFLNQVYQQGIRQFVVEHQVELNQLQDANILQVGSSIAALQLTVAQHRRQFSIPVIGITGSNGKTIIKEWLSQLLAPDFNVVKNPGSYNSQLGVPLAVWQMQAHHSLGIFEAGISRPGEMTSLQKVIQPTIGLFTNLGPAHNEGFMNLEEKLREKLLLFSSASHIIYCDDQALVAKALKGTYGEKAIGWGRSTTAHYQIAHQLDFGFVVEAKGIKYKIPFSHHDAASIENAGHCIALMLYLGYNDEIIRQRIGQLKTVPMRLELKQGINHCQIVDDTYNNDLSGLQISLDFLTGLQHKKRSLILSDVLQSGLDSEILTSSIDEIVRKAGVQRLIGIGPVLYSCQEKFKSPAVSQFYESTDDFLNRVSWDQFQDEAILVKGARPFLFEKIIKRLVRKIHGTVMEIDLGAMVDNLNFVKSRLNPGVKLMAMVKAFAYGSGSEEVASLLQYHKVDYLGVAYPDEGVELRKNRIQSPIMVMNPSEESFATMQEFELEPEIYNLTMLRSLAAFLDGIHGKVHIKLDTGMHRLGLEEGDIDEVIAILRSHQNIEVATLFSHLAGADNPVHDAFTREQRHRFMAMTQRIMHELGINPARHILNSSGILRFPDMQMDMVRLGIGLYGIDPTEGEGNPLKPVATLKTIISQIKNVKAGESIGYGRTGKASGDMVIATVAIGYADGFSRMFSNGKGVVSIHGKRAPVVGNVCMDMTMVDITQIDAKEGDEVVVFGKELPIQEIALRIHTIPYEILTSTSERVKRVFYAESL